MSFDTWVHLIEVILVGGIFGMSFWVLRQSRKRQMQRRALKRKQGEAP